MTQDYLGAQFWFKVQHRFFFSKLFYNTLLKKYIAEFSDITKISIVIPSYPDNIVTELLSLFITFEFCSFFNYVIFDTLSPIKIRLFS